MFFKDLSKKEKKHLSAEGIATLAKFSEVALVQKRMRDTGEFRSEPCFECKAIARKLGLPV